MKNILVIGDSCTDYYIYGTCDRLSPEAPVPVFVSTRTESKPGMAANVFTNLKALGANSSLITNSEKITKTRYIDEKTGQHLLRVDTNSKPVSCWSGQHSFDPNFFDALVVSDYNKGFLDYSHIENLRKVYKGPIFVDTKKTDLSRFEGCIVKINELEYSRRISDNLNLIVTLGSSGARYQNRIFPAFKTEICDVCGAGDTFLAALVFKFLNSNKIEDAIQFAIKASAITVSKMGVYAPTLGEIEDE